MKERFNNAGKGRRFLFAPIIIGILFAVGGIVMLLWNAVLPDLLGVKTIGYWQALGLLILCKILFSGFRPGHRGMHGRRGAILREKFAEMNPEERERFREEWRKRMMGDG